MTRAREPNNPTLPERCNVAPETNTVLATSQYDLVDLLRGAFTPEEVRDRCRVSAATVWRWLLTGSLASIKTGRKRLIPRSALNEFLAAGCVKPPPQTGRTDLERRKAAEEAIDACRTLGV